MSRLRRWCAGHVTGLTLAHDRAITVYGDAERASRSQRWMLLVMVCFTSLGLFLLSQANTMTALDQHVRPCRWPTWSLVLHPAVRSPRPSSYSSRRSARRSRSAGGTRSTDKGEGPPMSRRANANAVAGRRPGSVGCPLARRRLRRRSTSSRSPTARLRRPSDVPRRRSATSEQIVRQASPTGARRGAYADRCSSAAGTGSASASSPLAGTGPRRAGRALRGAARRMGRRRGRSRRGSRFSDVRRRFAPRRSHRTPTRPTALYADLTFPSLRGQMGRGGPGSRRGPLAFRVVARPYASAASRTSRLWASGRLGSTPRPFVGSVGGISKIDTRTPHDDMHDVDLPASGEEAGRAAVCDAGLCQSRVCGPVVDQEAGGQVPASATRRLHPHGGLQRKQSLEGNSAAARRPMACLPSRGFRHRRNGSCGRGSRERLRVDELDSAIKEVIPAGGVYARRRRWRVL